MLLDDDNATPTTRFIRNCEAVGLFNDLPPNPFEETFRMATANDLPDSLKVSHWNLVDHIFVNNSDHIFRCLELASESQYRRDAQYS